MSKSSLISHLRSGQDKGQRERDDVAAVTSITTLSLNSGIVSTVKANTGF